MISPPVQNCFDAFIFWNFSGSLCCKKSTPTRPLFPTPFVLIVCITVVVAGITPTPLGEGKSTTTVGLCQAFGVLGRKVCVPASSLHALFPIYYVDINAFATQTSAKKSGFQATQTACIGMVHQGLSLDHVACVWGISAQFFRCKHFMPQTNLRHRLGWLPIQSVYFVRVESL